MSRAINEYDDFFARALKQIPTEVIGAYLAVGGMLSSLEGSTRTIMNWVTFAVFLVATPLWLIYVARVTTRWQNGLSMVAFVFWVMTIPNGPFSEIPPQIGSAGVLFYSAMLAPMVAGMAVKSVANPGAAKPARG